MSSPINDNSRYILNALAQVASDHTQHLTLENGKVVISKDRPQLAEFEKIDLLIQEVAQNIKSEPEMLKLLKNNFKIIRERDYTPTIRSVTWTSWHKLGPEIKREIRSYLEPGELLTVHSLIDKMTHSEIKKEESQLIADWLSSNGKKKIPVDKLVELIQKAGPALKRVNGSTFKNVSIVLEALAKYCPNLEKLSLSDCNQKLMDRFCQLIDDNRFSELKSLFLLDCGVNDAFLKSVATHNKKLEKLKIQSILEQVFFTDNGLQLIIDGCEQLKSLDLMGCKQITGSAFQSIATNSHGTTMESIYLADCNQIPPAVLQSIVNHYTNLSSLNLYSCQVTEDFFNSINSHNGLQKIYFANAPKLTDATLQALVIRFKELRVIELHNCHALTDVGLKSLMDGLENLESLQLSKCKKIKGTTFELTSLLPHRANLTSVFIESCNELSDHFLQFLLTNYRNLKVLQLLHCPMSDHTMQILSGSTKLEDLTLWNCNDFKGIECLETLVNLKFLNLKYDESHFTQVAVEKLAKTLNILFNYDRNTNSLFSEEVSITASGEKRLNPPKIIA